jgi:hypothetical protein
MSENKDYHHSTTTSFAGHQLDAIKHKSEDKHIVNVRHPMHHTVIHSTEPHKTQAEALLAAKQWIHLSSPESFRSRRGGRLFKAEEDVIAEYMAKSDEWKKVPKVEHEAAHVKAPTTSQYKIKQAAKPHPRDMYPHNPTPQDHVEHKDKIDKTHKILSELKPEHKEVLERHHGLNGHEPHTHEQAQKAMGLTPGNHRGLLNRAEREFRNQANKQKINPHNESHSGIFKAEEDAIKEYMMKSEKLSPEQAAHKLKISSARGGHVEKYPHEGTGEATFKDRHSEFHTRRSGEEDDDHPDFTGHKGLHDRVEKWKHKNGASHLDHQVYTHEKGIFSVNFSHKK